MESQEVMSSRPAVLPECLVPTMPEDPDFHSLAEAWPRLPENVRRAILALVEPFRDGGQD